MVNAIGTPNSDQNLRARENLTKGTPLQGGAFIVGPIVGQGGFGLTYRGGDTRLHRYVAIKELFPLGYRRTSTHIEAQDDVSAMEWQTLRQKFLTEARALARFQHPGIVQVLTIFEENNTAYLVMEYLRGKTLRQRLDDERVLAEHDVLDYAAQIISALIVMHSANVIHCDIKPDNLMICEEGRVVLIDFGLNKKLEDAAGSAKSTNYATRRLTTTLPQGTAGYAAPEQYVKSKPLGAFTDNYGLGATLYHLLTGIEPISAAERALGAVLLSPAQVNPLVSQDTSEVIMRMLELDAAQRPQTSQRFLELVKGISAGHNPATQVVATMPMAANPPVSSPLSVEPPMVNRASVAPAEMPIERNAPVSTIMASAPPKTTHAQINNTCVWLLVVAALTNFSWQDMLATAIEVKTSSLWFVPVLVNVVIALCDEQHLKDMGYDTERLWVWLAPVYLFQRAKLLDQNKFYVFAWMVMFALSFVF